MKWPRIRTRYTRTKAARAKCYIVDAGAYGLTDAQRARGVKRNRKTFATLKEAEQHAQVLRTQRQAEHKAEKFSAENRAVSLARLTDGQRTDTLEAFRLLDDGRKGSLVGAVKFWLQHAAPANPRTVSETVDELLTAMDRSNRRQRTLDEMRIRLRSFTVDHGTRGIYAVTMHDLEEWLANRTGKLSPRSQNNYRRCLHRLFAFAVKRGHRADNPAAALERPIIDPTTPGIHTPAEVQRLLNLAQQTMPKLVPYLAIGYFAGLRTENELAGLDWRNVDLEHGTIHVLPETAKKRRERFVDIQPNLRAWLALHAQTEGRLYSSEHAVRSLRKKAKIEWPQNVMRHSFASYHLAAFGDAARTALALGHPHGVEVLFAHYRSMVREKTALEYWAIVPAHEGNIIQLHAAG